MRKRLHVDLEKGCVAGEEWLLDWYEGGSINRKAAFFRRSSDISLTGNAK
jgi:hypothetical protein